jgi:hypothetical protein
VSQFKKLDNGDWAQNVQLTGSNVPDSQRIPSKVINSLGQELSISSGYGNNDGTSENNLALVTTNYQIAYSGSKWDRWRNNTEGTLLASAARTASLTSATQTNYNAKGVMVFLKVTGASGTGGLRPNFVGIVPSGIGEYLNANITPITAVGMYVFVLYPGASTAGVSTYIHQVTDLPLPRTWRLDITHSDASSYTYEVSQLTIL